MTHPWWPHLVSFPRVLDPVSWLWLSQRGYALTSSIGIGWVIVLGNLWWHTRCDSPRCMRKGRHKTADGHHKLCRPHHPDLPNRKPSLNEIHLRHHAASKEAQDG